MIVTNVGISVGLFFNHVTDSENWWKDFSFILDYITVEYFFYYREFVVYIENIKFLIILTGRFGEN